MGTDGASADRHTRLADGLTPTEVAEAIGTNRRTAYRLLTSLELTHVEAGARRFYNSRRIQKRLDYLSPVEFEEQHYADQATAKRTNLKLRQPALTG
ncbi:IS3 family transposase [Streptomyces phaeochromogenes]|uniref:IS3 family transposase n=1 Tax=Streptomyces phaeochromogenes TaxID=1923 RepID=UPI0038644E82|nr:hypothetical protein OG277_52290 [Streptomyces phaeochromogenes]